jgi:hypothetical protein
MREYVDWLRALPGRPVFVAYPAAYDFMFVYWYLMRFVGESPFSHSELDIKTFAMCLLGIGYRDATKGRMPKRWFDDLPHTHVALDDALGQGAPLLQHAGGSDEFGRGSYDADQIVWTAFAVTFVAGQCALGRLARVDRGQRHG